MTKRISLSDKVVMITGAGRGVGACTARLLDQAGCRLALADLDRAAVVAVAAGLRDASVFELDISDAAAFEVVLKAVEDEHGRIDVLVNNAGIMPIGHFESETDGMARRQVEVNLLGTIFGTRLAYQTMSNAGSGHVINVASIAGKAGAAGMATYSATKFGIVGYTEAVRSEAHGSGIHFSTVLPGVINTELSAGMSGKGVPKAVTPEDVAATIADVIRRPRREAYVPGNLAVLPAIWALIPRSLLDWFVRRTGGDRAALSAVGAPQRAEYEKRICADPDRAYDEVISSSEDAR